RQSLCPRGVHRVVAVQAAALDVPGAPPVLGERSGAEHGRDRADAQALALRAEDLPLPDPEVEVVLGSGRVGARHAARLGIARSSRTGPRPSCDRTAAVSWPAGQGVGVEWTSE